MYHAADCSSPHLNDLEHTTGTVLTDWWREMTPPKHTEETVHNREAQIVQLVDAVPDAVVIVHQDGAIVHINTQT